MTLPKRADSAQLVLGRSVSKARQLADLVGADRRELQDQWLDVFGQRPPKRLSRELLVLALSYQTQSMPNDGLSAEERRQLGITGPDWVAGGPSIIRAQRSTVTTNPSDRPDPPAKLDADAKAALPKPRLSPRPVRRFVKPGTRLLREWQGQTHEVIAESTGQFLYHGETYRSLSAIARAITGTRWSGPTFFGIATKAQANRSAGSHDA